MMNNNQTAAVTTPLSSGRGAGGEAKATIEAGKAILGIEFGSTRIKAVLIDEENKPIAQGSHEWENQLVDGL